MVAGALFEIDRSACVLTVVEVVLLVLLPPVGSFVPSEVTVALFDSTVPSATEERDLHVDGERRRTAGGEARACSCRSRSGRRRSRARDEPAVWKVVPAGSVSLTWKPPMLSDGPLLVTVSV